MATAGATIALMRTPASPDSPARPRIEVITPRTLREETAIAVGYAMDIRGISQVRG
jgi:hypothetical protein